LRGNGKSNYGICITKLSIAVEIKKQLK